MWRLVRIFSWIVALGILTNLPISHAQSLRPDEYGAVALIYSHELSALGDRALFPMCIGVPSDTSTKAVFEYLLKSGIEVSEASVCEPAMAAGGQHHPKDYPHGLRIFVDKPQATPERRISIHVVSDDLTVRPGEHSAATLRRGTYHLKKNEVGEWQVVGYTKEYDSKDEQAHQSCDCPKAASIPTSSFFAASHLQSSDFEPNTIFRVLSTSFPLRSRP